MNREIKFRVWDSKIMRADFVLRADGVADDDLEYIDDAGNKIKGIVMQFTGLRDKNGKEIYEGDILQDGEYPYRHLIAWDNEAVRFVTVLNGNESNGLEQSWIDEIQKRVIGNIYENPELL